VHLRRGLAPGEPLGGNRDRHEQQPDQRPRYPGTRNEEVVYVGWNHRTIFARPARNKGLILRRR